MSKTVGTVSSSPSLMAAFVTCGLVFATVGCNNGPEKPDHIPDLTPLTITVMYNGQPVEGASVLLAPKSGQFSAAGNTNAAGQAVMKTDGMYEGVVPGAYRASVTKREDLDIDFGPSPSDPAEYAEWEQKLKNQPVPKYLVPEKYSSFGSSGLTVTVAEGEPGETTFELTD